MDSKHVNIQMESKAPKAKVLSEAEKKQEKKRILKITIGYICLFLFVLSAILLMNVNICFHCHITSPNK